MEEAKNETLFEKLIAYAEGDIYPFCMPGHKRHNRIPGAAPDPYRLDITEVEGFDDLHRPNGILKAITDRAGRIYEKNGIRPKVFMSVNGSTACNLAAVSAMPEEGPVLIAANCHRSVFHGAQITKRNVIELAPQWVSKHAVYGGIAPADVDNALTGYPDIRAVVITSPSYEGFVSDIKTIAQIVHAHGAYLIVDEAHGAHLPFCDALPESALYLGADIVIHSLHKTVGSLNQTALAFVNAEELADNFREKLLLFTTTSPSYLLMASIEQALLWADANRLQFDAYCRRLFALRKELCETDTQQVQLVDRSITGSCHIFDLDEAKLMFYAGGVSGRELYLRFYEDYRLQFEKYGDRYALAMTTVWDTEEGFARLADAARRMRLKNA